MRVIVLNIITSIVTSNRLTEPLWWWRQCVRHRQYNTNFLDCKRMGFSIGKMSSISRAEIWHTLRKMCCYWAEEYNTSVTTTLLFTCGSKQVPACICSLNTLIFGNISPARAKEYLTAAMYYCQVEVKVCDQIAAVISEIGQWTPFFCLFPV